MQSEAAYAAWYAKNGEKVRQRARDWYESNRERHRANSKRYRTNNPDNVRASQMRWAAANVEKVMLARAKSRAKKYGIEFSVQASDISIPAICPVLGISLCMGGQNRDAAPSIDRIDNSRGYVPGNVVVVSWRANRLKGDASNEELAKLAAFYSQSLHRFA